MEPSLTLFHLISIITTFLSVSMGFFLLFIKAKSNTSNKYLGLLVLTYSLFFIPGFQDALGWLEAFPHFIRLNFFAGVIVGPLTYLYCKSSIQIEKLKLKNNFWHIIPFVIGLVYYFPFFLLSPEEKIANYHGVISTGQIPEHRIVIVIISLLTMAYAFASIRLVKTYKNHIENTRSTIDVSLHKWLMFLAASLIAPIFVVILVTYTSNAIVSIPAALFTVATFIIIIYIALNLRPKFFHHFPHQIEKDETITQKYKGSNLQNHQKDLYQSKLLDFMEQEKPYLDPELSINQFSEQINIPSYYVSQIINEKLNCTFLDFVNQYRINEAKKKLMDASKNHFTVMAIAHDSGFNSKTAFYSAFKKNVGGTPNQFRKKEQLSAV